MSRQLLPKKYHSVARGMGGVVPGNSGLAVLIGRCASASTNVEVHMSLLMGSLLGVSNTASVAVFSTLRNARSRREALDAAAKSSLGGEDQNLFQALMNIHKKLDGLRNDIIHGMWGWIEGVDDSVLWCSSESFAIWHINDYHMGENGMLSYEYRNNQFNERVYIWRLSDIEKVVRDLDWLHSAIASFHAYLRYSDRPAGVNALSRLMKDSVIQREMKDLCKE